MGGGREVVHAHADTNIDDYLEGNKYNAIIRPVDMIRLLYSADRRGVE